MHLQANIYSYSFSSCYICNSLPYNCPVLCVCVKVGGWGRVLRDLSWCKDFKGVSRDSSILASSRDGGKLLSPWLWTGISDLLLVHRIQLKR